MRRGWTSACIAGALLLSLVRCAPARRDAVLRFFFDVPASGPSDPDAARRVRRQWVSRASFKSVHAPFAAHRCAVCHDAEQPASQRGDARAVCGQCHEATFAPRRFLHGPFAAGACVQCHAPHVSAFPKLLSDNAPNLCNACHEAGHGTTCRGQLQFGRSAACLNCHDPHGAADSSLLRETNAAAAEGTEHRPRKGGVAE